jgi:hypothetical protein
MAKAALDEGDHWRARHYVRALVGRLRGSPDEWAAGAIIELAAAAAASAGEAERALRLAAAGKAQRLAAGMTEQGAFGHWLEGMLEGARRALTSSARARAEKLGRNMTREQTFDDVLAE